MYLFIFMATAREERHEKQAPLRYTPAMEGAFIEYQRQLPLDLGGESQDAEYWRIQYQLSRLAFAQLIAKLLASRTLDEFVTESASDFDNLAPAIEAAITTGLLRCDVRGRIESLIGAHSHAPNTAAVVDFEPRAEFNQFPCDAESRRRRAALLRERYAHAEHVRLALIGDDDFVSLELLNDPRFEPTVLEKDPRIVGLLCERHPSLRVLEEDVRSIHTESLGKKVATFMTDPPYTLDGALSFICAGMKLLSIDGQEREFYVILNQTMMGKKLSHLQQILANAGVHLSEMRPNFSQYRLPSAFAEKSRAAGFLEKHGIESDGLLYSSSSNLYIFRTVAPDIAAIESHIQPEKLYNHYS